MGIAISASSRIGRTLVTNTQYAAFTDATGFTTHAEERGFGLVYGERFWEETEGASWRYPAGPVGPCWRDLPDHPAVHLCAGDADAYAAWALYSRSCREVTSSPL
ncbi:SUMF1/EgtB/PvdO family nonheme iron enzyme [Streptomyces sp. NPDC048255]|uniref:SUMF1/EgtB/PvdO family nonheme iron enzyme n=1 Tax=Streptomyces sp. NPDC048255 TaxID=3154713 RepID=UPI0033E04CB4